MIQDFLQKILEQVDYLFKNTDFYINTNCHAFLNNENMENFW